MKPRARCAKELANNPILSPMKGTNMGLQKSDAAKEHAAALMAKECGDVWQCRWIARPERYVFAPMELKEKMKKPFNRFKTDFNSLCFLLENAKELPVDIVNEIGVLFFFREHFESEFKDPKKPWKEYLAKHENLWSKQSKEHSEGDSKMPAEDQLCAKAEAKERPNAASKRSLEELQADNKETKPKITLPYAQHMCLFNGCRKCATYSPMPFVQGEDGLQGPVCCKTHRKDFKKQYVGKRFVKTHSGENWTTIFHQDKPVLANKDRSAKWRTKKKEEEEQMEELLETYKQKVRSLEERNAELDAQNCLMRKILKDQGVILNQWLADNAPEGAVHRGVRGGFYVLQSGYQKRGNTGGNTLSDSESELSEGLLASPPRNCSGTPPLP